jgi:SAM-dependent methyltransferase
LGDLLETQRYEPASFDVVTMWDVLEHLPNPIETLRKVYALLKPNGKLIVATPNIDSVPARILKENWFPLEIPRHLVLYSPQTVSSLLAKTGFTVDQIKFRRRGAGISQSIPYLADGGIKTLSGVFRMRWACKLSGTILAMAHQSDEIVIYAAKNESAKVITKER